MFTQVGFLGTKALVFMDIITIYFGILPFLLLFSIRYAVKKMYKKHFVSQSIILAFTLCVVLIFEVGVRFSGGFLQYAKYSSLPFDFLLIFLIVHILVALAAIAGWLYLYISSYRIYKDKNMETVKITKHKKIGKAIFAAITLTSMMGIAIYIFLFVFISY